MTTRTISACVFVSFDGRTGELTKPNPKPYFYLNTQDLPVGSLALTHNGRDFSVVEIIRNLPHSAEAAAKVKKPLIERVFINRETYLLGLHQVQVLESHTTDALINQAIEEELKKPITPPTSTEY